MNRDLDTLAVEPSEDLIAHDELAALHKFRRFGPDMPTAARKHQFPPYFHWSILSAHDGEHASRGTSGASSTNQPLG
jgi:hypothetical protein